MPEPSTSAAARSAMARQWRLARRGRSWLHAFTGRSAAIEEWRHYPRRDAVDASGRWQFYFHAHPQHLAGDALPAEAGHIHLFSRSGAGRLTHLAALALDARGMPLRWFAPNGWVTGERWQSAPALARRLRSCELKMRGPLSGVALWLADLLRVYREPLIRMLQARDAALQRHCAAAGQSRRQALEDRSVAVWSFLPVRWPEDALAAGVSCA